MRLCILLFITAQILWIPCFPQSGRSDIRTDFVLAQKRAQLEKDLRERVTGRAFSVLLDSNTEYKFELACHAVSQFLFATPVIAEGMDKLFAQYDFLQYDTRMALLEAVYAVYPAAYVQPVKTALEKEGNPKLFAICALYLYRNDTTVSNCNALKIAMVEKFPGYDSLVILRELEKYLDGYKTSRLRKPPGIRALFVFRRPGGQKTIYSFQRWNRNYPGLAIVQNADGSFVRGENGRLQVFEQLARSGSNLPYFITNGNTPQGIYSIQGLAVAHNNFIGPTPNIQLIMPNEGNWPAYFQLTPVEGADQPPAGDTLNKYLGLMPASWRTYEPMMEAWYAGKAGRTEIIAHGSTLDPEFFSTQAFYPLTPTQGCLCAKELWNPTTGRLLLSEQFNLVTAFRSGQETKPGGYLFVINLDDRQKAVSREEVEALVREAE